MNITDTPITPQPTKKPRAYKRRSLICESAVKAFALHISDTKRNGKFKRVSREFIEAIDAHLRAFVLDQVTRRGGSQTL